MTDDLIIVGASLAGVRGAEAARRMGYRGPITLIGAEPHRRLHRSPARHPPQRGISHPHRHRMGGVPRPLPTPPSSPGRLRPSLGTNCAHEHSCLRCSLLRPDPTQRRRITEIRESLLARITEAELEGWLGEVEGLKVSLGGAEQKLAQAGAGLSGFASRRYAAAGTAIRRDTVGR
jgi:hypothetical protein